jgi:hypothetical protein
MAGNMSDMSDMSDTGNQGLSLGASIWPDRVDYPFVVVPDPADATKRASDHRFGHVDPFDNWTTEWNATKLLAEFTDTQAWRNRAPLTGNGETVNDTTIGSGLVLDHWRTALGGGADTLIGGATNDEIDNLITAAETERADALGEIVGQQTTFVPHLLTLLDASPASRPHTNLLINACVLIAGFAGQHFKRINQRRRPAQVCPALNPPIDVPGHGAYPSGHAAQAHLCGLSLAMAFGQPPTIGGTAVQNFAPNPVIARKQAGAMPAIHAFAWRAARNREIAGVHYRSDTMAGRKLAESLFVALHAMPGFQDAIRAANGEWK